VKRPLKDKTMKSIAGRRKNGMKFVFFNHHFASCSISFQNFVNSYDLGYGPTAVLMGMCCS